MSNSFPNFCIETSAHKLKRFFCGIEINNSSYAFDIAEEAQRGISMPPNNWHSFVEPFIKQMQSTVLQADNATTFKPLSLNTRSLIEVVKAYGYGCKGQASLYQLSNQTSSTSSDWLSGTSKNVAQSICNGNWKFNPIICLSIVGIFIGIALSIIAASYLKKRWNDGSISSTAAAVSTRVGACCNYLSTPFRSKPQNDASGQYVQMKELESAVTAQGV